MLALNEWAKKPIQIDLCGAFPSNDGQGYEYSFIFKIDYKGGHGDLATLYKGSLSQYVNLDFMSLQDVKDLLSLSLQLAGVSDPGAWPGVNLNGDGTLSQGHTHIAA